MENQVEEVKYLSIPQLQNGQKVSQVFLVKSVSKKRYDDSVYTVLTFRDREGEIDCFIWDDVGHFQSGDFVQVTGVIKQKKDDTTLFVSTNRQSIMPVKQPVSLEAYIFALDNLTIDRMWRELNDDVASIQDDFIKKMLDIFIREDFKVGNFDWKTCPLTDERYGNYSGALLEHVIYSLRHAKTIQQNYFDRNCPINPDILKAIIMLHDIGRLASFENIYSVSKTHIAKIVGIPNLTLKVIVENAPERESSEESVLFAKLLHGVDVCNYLDKTPLFIEALISQQVQKLDALMSIYSKTINGAKEDQLFTWENPILKTELLNG